MKDNRYEAKDYTYLRNLSDKGESLLKTHSGDAFNYILHNVREAICRFDPSFGNRLYSQMTQFEIKSDYIKALKCYQELMDDYFQGVIVDINEHHGF